MKEERMTHKDVRRILFTSVVLLLWTTADSQNHHTTTHPENNISPETVELPTSTAASEASTTLQATHKTTPYATNAFTTTSAATLNATESTSNTPHPPVTYPSLSTTDTAPSEPACLQGWAIFLICLGTIVTVFLLPGIPLMLYCFLQGRHMEPQQCSRYNRKIYVVPEEQTVQVE